MTISLEVENLSLIVPYYVQPERQASTWLSTLLGAATAVPRRHFTTILDDVSFKAAEGDRIALVGRNGAGKSSLLRVLAGAFEPTLGTVRVEGSRQALLSMALGFNQEATIMENIFLRATAMRMPTRQIKDIVDPVLDFSGLREVANRRLLTLSSGQRMRLSFAITTAVQHDIMLFDEWFGTGDAQFLRRARERLVNRIEGSGIVVMASHNDGLLRTFCNRALLIDGGRLLFEGSVEDVLAEYKKLYPPDPEQVAEKKRQRAKLRRKLKRKEEAKKRARKERARKERRKARVKSATAKAPEGTETREADSGDGGRTTGGTAAS